MIDQVLRTFCLNALLALSYKQKEVTVTMRELKESRHSWSFNENLLKKIDAIKKAGLFESCAQEIMNTMITEVTDTHLISDEIPVDADEFNDAVYLSIKTIYEYYDKAIALLDITINKGN